MPMFFTTEQINPSLTLLSDNYAKIRDEFKNVRDELEYTNWNGNNEYTSIKKSPYDGWKVAPLYAKGIGIHKDNAVKMPTLLKLCLKAGIGEDLEALEFVIKLSMFKFKSIVT